ncbi:MAG TPA: winged helix-turn-helix domain-containing protein [Xanthobacteraceae bacterium]|nr:winged helix-turn-helix domain-containing protein [Xanthobacteraceae bacterium]
MNIHGNARRHRRAGGARQDSRLDIYRLLTQAGPGGLAAGEVASRLGLAPNTLSFHLERMRSAGLMRASRTGRSVVYSARLEQMNTLIAFLTDTCGNGIGCAPAGPLPAGPSAQALP